MAFGGYVWCQTHGRLLFATAMTLYTVVGCRLHERDAVQEKGQCYLQYMRRVPQLLPFTMPGKLQRLCAAVHPPSS